MRVCVCVCVQYIIHTVWVYVSVRVWGMLMATLAFNFLLNWYVEGMRVWVCLCMVVRVFVCVGVWLGVSVCVFKSMFASVL